MRKPIAERFTKLRQLIVENTLVRINGTNFLFKGNHYFIDNGRLVSSEGKALVIDNTYVYLEHIEFVSENPPPYNHQTLAYYWFHNKLPKQRKNFWLKDQIKECFHMLLENGEEINQKQIEKNHYDLFKAIQNEKDFKPKDDEITSSFHKFLFEMGLDPDDVYLKNTLLEMGKYYDKKIKLLIHKYAKKDVFDINPCIDGVFPDLFNKVNNEIVDIKSSLRTPITKEKEKYSLYGKSVVVYLFGSLTHTVEEDGVLKLHINGWVRQNHEFFTDSSKLIEGIIYFLNKVNPEEAERTQNEYYLHLVNDIFSLYKKGYTQEQIAETLVISRRYVGLVLEGDRLHHLTKDQAKEFKAQKEEGRRLLIERDNHVFSLIEEGYTYAQIADKLTKLYGQPITVAAITDLVVRTKKENGKQSGPFLMFSAEGQLIDRYETIPQCVTEYPDLGLKVIYKCLRDLINSYQRYIFIYEEVYNEEPGVLDEKVKRIQNSTRGKSFRIISQKTGEVIGIYTNQREAARAIGMCYKKVNYHLRHNSKSDEFIFEIV